MWAAGSDPFVAPSDPSRDDGDQRVTAIRDGGRCVGIGTDRGWNFAGDWVREIQFAQVADSSAPLSALRAFVDAVFGRATVVRWWQSGQSAARYEKLWERWGAIAISAVHRASEPVPGDDFLYELTRPNLPWRFRTRRGLVVSRPRPSDIAQLIAWSQDANIVGPMGYSTPPTESQMGRLLLPPLGAPPPRRELTFHVIRQHDRPIGLFVEYPWDYANDTIRELDIALPGLAAPGTTLIVDTFAAMIDNCFRRGATRVITNSRAGNSGEGFPRLYSLLGDRPDVTDSVNVYGFAPAGRRFYATSSATFYASRAGARYRGCQAAIRDRTA